MTVGIDTNQTNPYFDGDTTFCYGTGRNVDCYNKLPHAPHYFDPNLQFDVRKLSLIHRARHYKNYVLTYVDDYAVEFQTIVVVLAGVVLTDRVVRSNQSVKKEMRFTNRHLEEIHSELHFGNDEAAFDREETRYQRDNSRRNITEAHQRGEHFEYYPGLGVFFPDGGAKQ